MRARPSNFARMESTTEPASPSSPTKAKQRIAKTKVELSAYFSVNDKNKEPTKENFDKVVDSPSGTITMPIMGKDRFENDEVYISLYSLTGCEVYLTPSFPDLKISNFSRKQIKDDYADEADFENYLVVKNWKKFNRNKGDKDSLIKEHVFKVGNYPEIMATRAHRLQ